MTNTDLIKGLLGIRYTLEANKEELPEQTKVQQEVIDEVITLLEQDV